jgi:WD40 repeat protein
VLLFELLAGRLPLNVQRLSVADAVRVICEDDPSSLGSISRALRGDLDTIVRRAMEKNPARRYPTAGAFAADLRRFLRHEPLVARPPTTWYQLCKFARRHRALVTGVIIALVGLAFAAIAGVRQAVIEARARRNEQVLRQLADARAEEARRTAYRATMIAAADALHYHDLAGARLRLRETPADLRGWEYRHLDARIDEARLTIPIDVAPNLGLYFADHSSTLYLPDYQPPLSRVWGWNTTTGTLQTSPNSSPPWHDARGGCPEFKDVPLRLPDPDTGEIRLYDPGAWGVPKSAGLRAPRLGPGGRLFVFVTVLDSGPRLWFVDRASGWAASAPLSGTVNPGNRFIVISPDERRAIFMRDGWDGCVYNTQSAEVVATCEGHPQHSRPALFTANGLRIIAATDTNGLIAWDTETGRRLAHRADGSHDIMCLAGAGDPDTFASGGSDGAVRLWSADTLTPIGVRWGHVAPVRQLAFSPDTRTLASAADDRTLRLWSLDRFDETDLLAGHAAPVAALAISSDGKYVASGSTDGDVRLWLASTGRPIVSMAGHEDAVFQLAFSGNGAYLASAGNGPSIRVWSLPSGACVGSSTPRVFVTSGLGFHRDNRRVVLPWDEGEPISLWDPQTNTVEAAPFAVLAEILSPIVSPDRRLAVRGNRVFEVATGRVAARLPIPDFGTSTYSADGAQLITPAPGGDVALWNTRTLAQIRTLACQAREVNAIAVTPDGSRIFVAYSEPVIRIFDGHSYDEVAHLVGHTAAVRELRLSPDGSWLVSASDDKTVRIWRARATSE